MTVDARTVDGGRVDAGGAGDGRVVDPRFPVSGARLATPGSTPSASRAGMPGAASSASPGSVNGAVGGGRSGWAAAHGWPELSPRARLWLGRLITFHLVCLAWIFFRATSFHNAVEVLRRIGTFGGRHHPFNWKVAAVVVGSLAIQVGPRGVGARLQVLFSRSPFWLQALYVAGVLTAIDLLGPAGVAPFIYFRF